MEVSFPHETKKLQAGLDDHKSHAAAYDAEGDIQKPEENDIFYVPKPFKTKRSHLFSPRIKLCSYIETLVIWAGSALYSFALHFRILVFCI